MGTVQVHAIEPRISRQVLRPGRGICRPLRKAKEPGAPSGPRASRGRWYGGSECSAASAAIPHGAGRTFVHPVPDIERYQRATTNLVQERVAGLVEDGATRQRVAIRSARRLHPPHNQKRLQLGTRSSNSVSPNAGPGGTAVQSGVRV
jgi:hypothetical protein